MGYTMYIARGVRTEQSNNLTSDIELLQDRTYDCIWANTGHKSATGGLRTLWCQKNTIQLPYLSLNLAGPRALDSVSNIQYSIPKLRKTISEI